MPISETTLTLPDIPLFNAMDEDQLRAVEHRTRRIRLARGEALFLEGDVARGFYVLTLGRVKVYKSSPLGREQILHVVGPGESVGEVAMFSGETFPATAEALVRTEAVFVPKQALLDMVTGEPEVAMTLLAGLSRRLREFARLIEDLSLRDVQDRLAAYLLYQSRDTPSADALTLPLSKTQLASMLGTVPETLSRAFQRLSKEGLVYVKGQTVQIKDRPALQKAAWSREDRR